MFICHQIRKQNAGISYKFVYYAMNFAYYRQPLPEPKPGQHVPNKLDKLTQSYRRAELQTILESAAQLKDNATDVRETLNEAENFLQMLKNLAQEVNHELRSIYIFVYWDYLFFISCKSMFQKDSFINFN